jgi:hypothetical protein
MTGFFLNPPNVIEAISRVALTLMAAKSSTSKKEMKDFMIDSFFKV